MPRKKAPSEIYQIKVTLKNSKPPIWRRLLVPSNITLARLHDIIQVAMGWQDYHLHQFTIGGVYYGEPEPDMDWVEVRDERRFHLNQLSPGAKFVYEYDFGDGWEHVVLIEKALPPDPERRYPVCIKGRRACPPEDVGGIWGYEEFLKAIQDPKHEEHEEYLEWVGGEFDPERFDLEEVNAALSRFW